MNDQALKELFPCNVEGRRRERISCNVAVSGHPLPHAETPSSLHFSSPHPAPPSPSPLFLSECLPWLPQALSGYNFPSFINPSVLSVVFFCPLPLLSSCCPFSQCVFPFIQSRIPISPTYPLLCLFVSDIFCTTCPVLSSSQFLSKALQVAAYSYSNCIFCITAILFTSVYLLYIHAK